MATQEKVLLEAEEMEQAIARLAHEIIEQVENGEAFALVGIETRGAYLARRIAQRIETLNRDLPAMGTIDVTPLRDDLEAAAGREAKTAGSFPFSLDDRVVFLVDDVIYTGRTTRVALDLITQMGKPAKILVAVLVDRGNRELPIKADIVGKNVRVSEGGRVNVLFREADGVDRVVVSKDPRHRGRAPARP